MPTCQSCGKEWSWLETMKKNSQIQNTYEMSPRRRGSVSKPIIKK